MKHLRVPDQGRGHHHGACRQLLCGGAALVGEQSNQVGEERLLDLTVGRTLDAERWRRIDLGQCEREGESEGEREGTGEREDESECGCEGRGKGIDDELLGSALTSSSHGRSASSIMTSKPSSSNEPPESGICMYMYMYREESGERVAWRIRGNASRGAKMGKGRGDLEVIKRAMLGTSSTCAAIERIVRLTIALMRAHRV